MVRCLFLFAALLMFSPAADAGPLRNWAQARRSGKRPVARVVVRIISFPARAVRARRSGGQVESRSLAPQAAPVQRSCPSGTCPL